MKIKGAQYFIDLESRYFQEDFLFGLCIFKAYAQITGVETPVMDKVLSWHQNLSGDVFLDYEGNLDIKAISCGSIHKDLA